MKEHPILFSAPMVRAILAGQKTMTRRILKPTARQVKAWNPDYSICPSAEIINGMVQFESPHGGPYRAIPLRWQPGDTLWVRETHQINASGTYPNWTADMVLYRADNALIRLPESIEYSGKCTFGLSWVPSIHMPRWASRITLAVEAVRVERLQDIGEADACAEGWPTDANPWVSVTTFRRVL
jgi:hypothetical protein